MFGIKRREFITLLGGVAARSAGAASGKGLPRRNPGGRFRIRRFFAHRRLPARTSGGGIYRRT